MGKSYNERQSTYTEGDIITAEQTNKEFNQLLDAFKKADGHTHDGDGEGGPITKLRGTSLTFGDGAVGDITINFDTAGNDGILKYINAANHFTFETEAVFNGSKKLYFHDKGGESIHASADATLEINAGTNLNLTSTNINLTGTIAAGSSNFTTSGDIEGGKVTVGNVVIDAATIGRTDNLDLLTLASSGVTVDGSITGNSLTIDQVKIDAATIGHTSDIDLITLASGAVTVAGSITADAVTVDDINLDGKVITMTGSTGDTAAFTVKDNGALDIVTTDASAAAANISITADGTAELAGTTVTLNSGGNITLDAAGGTLTFKDDGVSLGTITSAGFTGNVVGDVTGTLTAKASGAAAGSIIFQENTTKGSETATLIGPNELPSNITITLPTSTTTLIGRDTSDTLTNKSIDANATGNSITNLEVGDFAANAIDTDISSVSISHDTLASAKAIKTYIDTQITAQDLDFEADTGGALSIDLDSQKLTFTGGTGINTSGAGKAVTFAIDNTVATKAYVDTQVQTKDTLVELTDTNISSLGSGHILIHDGTDSFDNKAISGHITLSASGEVALDASAVTDQTAITSGIDTANDTLLLHDSGVGLKQISIATLIGSVSTSNLSEGTNKYFTDQRADDRITNAIGVTNGDIVKISGANADTNYAVFSTSGIEGKSIADVKSQLGVVENAITGSAPSISTPTVTGGLALKNGTTSAGFIEFFEDSTNSGDNKVTLIGPADVSSDYQVTLPASQGTLALTSQLTASLTAGTNSGEVAKFTSNASASQFIRVNSSNNGIESVSNSAARSSLGLGTAAPFNTGIAAGEIPSIATGGLSRSDFLRVKADEDFIEGLSASEVLSTIGAMPTSGGTFTGNVTISSTDDGSASAPFFEIYRDSASPADNDNMGVIRIQGNNDADEKLSYVEILTQLKDASDGTETGMFQTQVRTNGQITAYQTFFAEKIYNHMDVMMQPGKKLLFEGDTSNSFQTTLYVVDPTADREILLPDVNGTIPVTDANGSLTLGGVANVSKNVTTSGSSFTPNFKTHQNFILTLNNNCTIENTTTSQLDSGNIGQSGYFVFIQDASGAKTISLKQNYKTPSNQGVLLSLAANSISMVPYIITGTNEVLLGTPQTDFRS